jgi:predicted aldo/keto reductase-like oxidoreductase
MYCNHCLPCPSFIDVAAVSKYLDIAALHPDHIPPATAQHYRALDKHGSDCVACGSCERRCPFSVPVIKNMRRAAELFGA